eukprot:678797-Hanusia_phi.AAC.1
MMMMMMMMMMMTMTMMMMIMTIMKIKFKIERILDMLDSNDYHRRRSTGNFLTWSGYNKLRRRLL